MPLDFSIVKKHPIAVGATSLVGFIVVYALSRGGSTSSGSNFSQAYSADAALGQAQTAAAVQASAQQAQVQQANIAAASANYQTDEAASVSNTQTLASLIASLYNGAQGTEVAQINANANTLQQANQETANQNIFDIQEAGLLNQVNAQVEENANNNATSLAAFNTNAGVETTALSDATGLATLQQQNFQKNVALLAPTFGKQYNSALDANNAAAEIETVLAGGNPGVASTGIQSSASSVVSGNNSSAAKFGAVAGGISTLLGGLFG